MKLKLLCLSILSLIIPSLSNAQGFAPNVPPINSIITWEGQYEPKIEDDPEEEWDYEDSGEIEIESATEFSGGTYQYEKTGLNTATIHFQAEDEEGEVEEGTMLIRFTSLTGGTYTSSGTYVSYFDEDGNPVEETYKTAGEFEFSFLMIASGNMPRLKVGTKYSQKLKATGGNSPYIWSVTKGKLPIGLKLDKTGEIMGTPKKAGRSTFTVKVTDRNKTTATKELTLRSYKP